MGTLALLVVGVIFYILAVRDPQSSQRAGLKVCGTRVAQAIEETLYYELPLIAASSDELSLPSTSRRLLARVSRSCARGATIHATSGLETRVVTTATDGAAEVVELKLTARSARIAVTSPTGDYSLLLRALR